jgi:hypothetical protein
MYIITIHSQLLHKGTGEGEVHSRTGAEGPEEE